MPGDVEPLVDGGPGIAPVPETNPVPTELRTHLQRRIARREVTVEVLFARQVRTPRRAAVAAVVPGAPGHRAGRIPHGLHELVAGRGSGDPHRGVGGDPAVPGRVDDDRPATVGAGDLDDRHAVAGLALAHVVGVLRLSDAGAAVDDLAVDVLVVHGEDAQAAGVEQGHAVVVVAEGALLAGAGAARGLVERLRVRPHGIAPPGNDMPTVARRHGHGIADVGGNRFEGHACRCGARGRRSDRGARGNRSNSAGARDERGGSECDAAAEKRAARDRSLGEAFEIGWPRSRIVSVIDVIDRDMLIGCGERCLFHLHLQVSLKQGMDSRKRARPRVRFLADNVTIPRPRRAGAGRKAPGEIDQARSKCSSGKYLASRSSPA